eukprot:TRINITY_DN6203_c0_g1_i2.p2 TRINITY_DN6203_c0_g1~~TRINITY_DN6203_c0_g1_i2.p2  ORF type:complete len:193 (+),score=11.69 TRINITY_DN6203_c0_g1_i2:3-581(+)
MFVLVRLKDVLKINPENFNNELEGFQLEVRRKYVNRIIKDVGLGVALYDVLEFGEGYVYPGDGAAHYTVTFRLVVLRPFVGEILLGRIKSCDDYGIQVTLDFFSDVYVVADHMPEPSEYDPVAQIWAWKYESYTMYMEPGSIVRLKVEAIAFNDKISKRPPKVNSDVAESAPPPAMMIVVPPRSANLTCRQR